MSRRVYIVFLCLAVTSLVLFCGYAGNSRSDQVSLAVQAAEQERDIVIQNVESLMSDYRSQVPDYCRWHTFGGDDIISNLFTNLNECFWHQLQMHTFEAYSLIVGPIVVWQAVVALKSKFRLATSRLVILMILSGVAFDVAEPLINLGHELFAHPQSSVLGIEVNAEIGVSNVEYR